MFCLLKLEMADKVLPVQIVAIKCLFAGAGFTISHIRSTIHYSALLLTISLTVESTADVIKPTSNIDGSLTHVIFRRIYTTNVTLSVFFGLGYISRKY